MLTKLEVKNFKNFKGPFIFDLSRIKNYEFNRECVSHGVVNKAIIYGPNGCGKSNLGLAVFDLVAHLTDKDCDRDFYCNYLYAQSDNGMAEFKFTFKFNGSVLEYGYGKNSIDLTNYEELTIDGVTVVKFSRDKPLETCLKGAETLNKDLSESKLSAIKYIKNNAVLEKDGINKVLWAFFNFVDSMLFFRAVDWYGYIGYASGTGDILQDILEKDHLREFEDFLNKAGVECELLTRDYNGLESIFFKFGDKSLYFWGAASTGTKSLTLFYYWLQRLREHEVPLVFIDEFDALYHHELSMLIVSELKKIPAQVILTTHNTSIMSNDLLRPDCYFVMQGNKMGPIYQFTDKELRRAHNIEKMYRAGAFYG